MNDSSGDYIVMGGVALIVLPMIAIIGYWLYANNSSDTKEMRATLFESRPYDIRKIELIFTSGGPKHAESQSVSITHADEIQEILSAMATRVEQNPPGAATQWTAMMLVSTAKRTVQVEVVRYHGYATMLLLRSGGASGWNLGTYACPQLGPVLDRLAGIVLEPEETPVLPENPAVPESTLPQ